MRRLFCCLKPKTQSGASARTRDEEVQNPFGDNELLNYAWRHNINLPDDRDPPLPDSIPNPDPFSLRVIDRSGHTFLWPEIVDGTQNLQAANFLGRGSFGSVYRCDLRRIDRVGAAKVEDLRNSYAHQEFVAEITTLHAANHPNVIKLLGKCFGQKQSVLVYEFMPKGSLDRYLYVNTRADLLPQQKYPVLDWDTRMRIAVGVAEGLVYLHEVLKTIHRDIKLSNVLLDENFVPKITDFGLATKIVEDEDGVERRRKIYPIKGSMGCIAPETEQSGFVSSKGDVYGYGVFLFSLFTGKKAFDSERPLTSRKLTDWLYQVWSKEEYVPMVVDVALGNRFSVEGLKRLFQAARM